MAIKPILFNTEMVRAILDGRKTCTRRLMKPQPQSKLCYTFAGSDTGTWGYPDKTAHEIWGEAYKLPDNITKDELNKRWNPPYHTDDISVVVAQFDSATDPDDDDTCKTIEEMKNYMAYGISYLEKAEDVLRTILSGKEIDPSMSVTDFEITQ